MPLLCIRRRAASLVTLLTIAAIVALTATGAAQAASPIVIDDFAADTTAAAYRTDVQGDKYTFYDVNATVPNGYVANELLTGGFGSQRSMELFVDGTPKSTSLALSVGYLTQDNSNELNVATNNGAGSAGVLTLNYSVLSGMNLAAGGNQDIFMKMPANDSANLDVAVTLTSGSGASAKSSTVDELIGSFTSPTNVAVPLSSFSTANGFTLANVTGVQLVFNGQSQLSNVDYRVQAITVAVPEPSSIVLLGLGAAGLAIAARRRRKA